MVPLSETMTRDSYGSFLDYQKSWPPPAAKLEMSAVGGNINKATLANFLDSSKSPAVLGEVSTMVLLEALGRSWFFWVLLGSSLGSPGLLPGPSVVLGGSRQRPRGPRRT